MKKFLIIATCLSATLSAVSAADNTRSEAAQTTTVAATQSWEYYTTVTVYKKNGNIKIGNPNHRVEYDSDSGKYRIQYGGEWYPVSYAPRGCGYTYMFSTGKGTWYFDM